jgi:hypothetical protein
VRAVAEKRKKLTPRTRKQKRTNLLGEQALAADVGQGLAQDLVARRLDDANLQGAVLGQVREGGLFFVLRVGRGG